jgi:uncharacterized protein YjbI with pentapeptide repeats
VLGLIIALIIIVWAIYGLQVLNLHQPVLEAMSQPIAYWFKQPGNPVRAGVIVLASIITITAWLVSKDSVLSELRGEITGIAITVVLIDELVRYRGLLERKQEIFEQIESPVRDVAVEAVRVARKYGWLDEALRKVNLWGAQLQGVNLVNVNLERLRLPGANLEKALLVNANLNFVDLNGANLQNATIIEARLQGAQLIIAKLNHADLTGADLEHADLMLAEMQRTDFTGANLQSANLSQADAEGAHFYHANLQNANLAKANLVDADLRGANLTGTSLSAAYMERTVYDDETIFPQGQSPKDKVYYPGLLHNDQLDRYEYPEF